MNFGAITGVYWRFNKVISTAENVLILNIIQVFLHLARYSELTLMALTISNHNGTLSADHFWI